jgi:hypothetical protein
MPTITMAIIRSMTPLFPAATNGAHSVSNAVAK